MSIHGATTKTLIALRYGGSTLTSIDAVASAPRLGARSAHHLDDGFAAALRAATAPPRPAPRPVSTPATSNANASFTTPVPVSAADTTADQGERYVARAIAAYERNSNLYPDI